jgi:hypothetical protein
MGTHLHDTGEEAMLRDFFTEDLAKPASLTIGLFSDSTAALTDSEDVADLANEPTGTSYSRQTFSFGTTDFTVEDNANNNWQAVISDVTFDTSDSTEAVDAYFVIINFQANDKGDTSASDHLLFTGNLDQEYNLSGIDSFTLSGAGLSLN